MHCLDGNVILQTDPHLLSSPLVTRNGRKSRSATVSDGRRGPVPALSSALGSTL